MFKGSFQNEHYDDASANNMYYYLTLLHNDQTVENITGHMKFPVVATAEMDLVKEIKRTKTVPLSYPHYERLHANKSTLVLNLYSDFNVSFPVNFAYDPSPLDKDMGIIYAAIVLLGLYIMIIWELVHRTFAAMIASTMSIGIFD